ncbi:MAG: hypothetical protein H7Z37_10640 [Pyrinomonadaceae bacterium]|nr:hypothetical protein [Pyrinomonadaceae bacterium]
MNLKFSLSVSTFVLTCVLCVAPFANAQSIVAEKPKDAPKTTKPKKVEQPKPAKLDKNNLTAEQVVETVIFYSGGRAALGQIRKTEVETGRITRFAQNGGTDDSTYERFLIRGETVEKDRVRVNQKLSATEYSLIYSANKVFGIINDSTFEPRDEATDSFQATIHQGLDALLRYKENGSTLALIGKEKQMGVELYTVDITDKLNHTTRFNISAKLFRVNSLEYTIKPKAEGAKPVKYVRRFYDYRLAQNLLVPFRSTLNADGKEIEELNLSTMTYGAKIPETQFQAV